MANRTSVVSLVMVAALAFGSAAGANPPVAQREDEARSILERIRLYRERHGLDGEGGSELMLARARWGYERWLAGEQQRLVKGGAGDGWVSLGPANGAGRMTALAPHPTADGTVLAGAASGGVWKTTDHGASWRPLTDGLSDLSVGALAYAPSDPEVVYLGSGEGGLGSFFVPGIGLLRSADGGETWFLPAPGEVAAEQFFALSVDPRDPDRVLAANERGLLATADGGASWQESLGHPDLYGVTEVLRSPDDPDRVWAALWCFSRCPTGLGRVMTSADGGLSWQPAAAGLPDALHDNPVANRLALAVAPSDPDVLWVGLNTSRTTPQGPAAAIYRSGDGGASWTATSDPGPYLLTQGWYDNAITVHPADPDTVVAAGVWYVRTTDGGATWTTLDPIAGGDWMGTDTLPHVDGHAFAWQGETLWLGCDGGVWASSDAGATWHGRNTSLVTRQYYGVALDPIRPDRLIGGTQDNKTNLRLGPGEDDWEWVLDGDGFETAVNPLAPDLVYGTIYGTLVFRSWDGGLSWEDVAPGTGGDLTPFATPLTLRPETPWQLFTGSSRVWRSDDAGTSWRPLGTEVGNGAWSFEVVRAVALTAADPERLMIGKGAAVYASGDGGASWWRSDMAAAVNNVAISPVDPELALACLARPGSGAPALLRTTDGGASWHPAADGLPPFAVQVARWHPLEPNTVYAGTDVGLYASFDGGLSWAPVGDGLPAVSVHDLRIADDGSRLVAATHGRGIWQLTLAEAPGEPPSVVLEGPAAAAIGESVTYTAVATDPDGDSLALRWLLGDGWQLVDGGAGPGSVSSSLDHGFASGGRYLVAANAVDGTGRSGFASTVVTVSEPGNDCATPRVIPGSGPFPFTLLTENVDATIGAADPEVPCADRTGNPDAGRWRSIWLELTPAVTGSYTISTCGSKDDTVLSAWIGPACGPYQPLPGGCNDNDFLRHCGGLDIDAWLSLELEAGTTVRIMVGTDESTDLGQLRITVDCTSCRPLDDGRALLVPAAARGAGAGATWWSTRLQLVNPGDEAASARLRLLPGPGSAAPDLDLEVAAGAAVDFDDVVGEMAGGDASGALRLAASAPLHLASRTATSDGAGGSYGQGIPPVAPAGEAAHGAAVRLFGLHSDGAFRTNLGLVNPGDDQVDLRVRLYDGRAELVGELERSLAPGSWLQLNRVFDGVGAGTGTITGGLAVIRQTSREGRFVAYASVVDERTGDPTYLAPSAPGGVGSPLWLPAAAHSEGVGGVRWRTDLALFNPSTGDTVVDVELIQAGGVVASRPVHIPKGWTTILPDVVAETLGGDGGGALRLTPRRNLVMATSRTYAAGDHGSYGQGIPGVLGESALAEGESGLLAGLRQDQNFRTNVGLVNTAARPVDVTVTAHGPDGTVLAVLPYRLTALSWRQANQPLPRGTAYAVVVSPTPGAAVLAYASVVDRATDDPTYIAAVPITGLNR